MSLVSIDMIQHRRKSPVPPPSSPTWWWRNSDDGVYGDQGDEKLLPSWPRNAFTKPVLFVIQLWRNPAHDRCFYGKGFADRVTYCELEEQFTYLDPQGVRLPLTFNPRGGALRSTSYAIDGRIGRFFSWQRRVPLLGRWIQYYRGVRPGGAATLGFTLRMVRDPG